MNTWIAVPTYWTYAEGETGEENTVFDHPTPLTQEGTLCRTLESFRNLADPFKLIIVIGTSHPSLPARAHARVAELVKPFAGDYPIHLVSGDNIDRLNNAVNTPILSLESYGTIRNTQLAVPFAAGADVVVGIDDDEIIEDPDFLKKVERFIGTEFEGDTVGGMAGPYFDTHGGYRIAGAADLKDHPNIFLKKNYFMDQAVHKSMTGAPANGIVKSNVAFGGNMCMSRDTIARACHDPYIPRGEDYDYVINAKMKGVNFYFQPSMAIVHLPPDSTGSQAGDNIKKLINDIKRFIYMRTKHDYHREHFPDEAFDIDYILPYPGPYVNEALDLQAEGIRGLDDLYPEFRKTRSPEELAAEAADTAAAKVKEFFAYREKWEQLMGELGNNHTARKAVGTFRVLPNA